MLVSSWGLPMVVGRVQWREREREREREMFESRNRKKKRCSCTSLKRKPIIFVCYASTP
jgi:hypothetical protein